MTYMLTHRFACLRRMVFVFVLAFALYPASGQELFSADQLKSDLQFYKTKLEENHPNLYLYSSKEQTDNLFDSLSGLITGPLTEKEFYRIITLTSQWVKDGHTLILPSAAASGFHNRNSRFLPLQVGILQDKLVLKMNCTAGGFIPEGAVITSLNGIPGTDIIRELAERQVRDGYNLSYACWILDTYFREYYSFIFGHPDSFEITYEQEGKLYTATIPALGKDSIYYYRKKNYPAARFEKIPGTGLTLNTDSGHSTAIIKIRDFHNEVLKNEYRQSFKKTIGEFFSRIAAEKTEHLVLDLRDNQGGDIENGVTLLSYLLDKPFRVVNGYACLKEGKIAPCHGPAMGIHEPAKQSFSGDLYVLINGGSFSNTAIVASCLKENKRAVFIGTETGGNPAVLAGYAKDYELPHTKISVQIPEKRFIMTSLAGNTGYGLKPDYPIPASSGITATAADEALQLALMLIRQPH